MVKVIDLGKDIKSQFEKEGLTYPRLKSTGKWGIPRSTLLDADTEAEAVALILKYNKDHGVIQTVGEPIRVEITKTEYIAQPKPKQIPVKVKVTQVLSEKELEERRLKRRPGYSPSAEEMTLEELRRAIEEEKAEIKRLEAQDETGWDDFKLSVQGKDVNIPLCRNHIIYYQAELDRRMKGSLDTFLTKEVPTEAKPTLPLMEEIRKAEEYSEIKQLYEKCGIKRRFRVVEDGVWIFIGEEGLTRTGQSSRLPGIFVSKADWKDHPKYVLETYLPSVDAELEKCVGFKVGEPITEKKPVQIGKVEITKVEYVKPLEVEGKPIEVGDYLLWGARLLTYGGMQDEKYLLKDPFYPKGEYDLTFTKEEFDALTLPSKQYVAEEYARLKEKTPADFQTRLAKLPEEPTREEEEEIEEELEEEEAEERPSLPTEVKKPTKKREIPVEVELSGSGGKYFEEFHRGEFHSSSSAIGMEELEKWVAEGKDEFNMYEALQQTGGDYWLILTELTKWGWIDVPKLRDAFKKIEEERYDDVTEEDRDALEEVWEDVLATEWTLTWKPEAVKWGEVAKDRELFHRKFKVEELAPMTVAEVKRIAGVKGVGHEGRKEDIARAIQRHDYPLPKEAQALMLKFTEAKKKLEEL